MSSCQNVIVTDAGRDQQAAETLSKTATTYELERFEKNAMFILNHFDKNKSKGIESDIERLTGTFQKYGFQFHRKDNIDFDQVNPAMEDFFKKNTNLKDYGCIILVIFANAIEDDLIYFGLQACRQLDILEYLKGSEATPILGTKPKILLIQPYQGKKDFLMRILRKDIKEESYYMPKDADILVIHGTLCNNIDETSGFIDVLCETILSDSDTDNLEAMLVEANRKMVPILKSKRLLTPMEKQLPIAFSTLTRKLFLKKNTHFVERDVFINNETIEDTNDPGDNYVKYVDECLELYIRHHPDDNVARSMRLLRYTNNSQTDLWSKLMSKYLSSTSSPALKYFYRIPE